MVNAKINGIPVQVAEGTSILDAARKVNVKIPTLCYNDDLEPWAACGICVVKNGKSPKMLRSCCTPLENGMGHHTNDADLVSNPPRRDRLILSHASGRLSPVPPQPGLRASDLGRGVRHPGAVLPQALARAGDRRIHGSQSSSIPRSAFAADAA
jgi:hypothetical protein